MPQSDTWKRYLDAGVEFTNMTRSRAESIVKELIKAGEVQREQRQQRVEELLERSRKNTEDLMAAVRKELDQRLSGLGVATKADLAKLEARIDKLAKGSSAAAKPPRRAEGAQKTQKSATKKATA